MTESRTDSRSERAHAKINLLLRILAREESGYHGIETLFQNVHHVMACHYSKPGEEFACAGWLHNQLGVGNNLGVRMSVMSGRMPMPEVDGEQHERFEDTLP